MMQTPLGGPGLPEITSHKITVLFSFFSFSLQSVAEMHTHDLSEAYKTVVAGSAVH